MALGHSYSNPLFSAADVVLEYEDGECVAVPHGTRTLQFVEGRRNGEIPVAAMLISGSAATNNVLTETCVRYVRFSEKERERVRGKMKAERKLFFRFIPPEYRRDRGVTTEEIFYQDSTQYPILCSDLLAAMRDGEYSWAGTQWTWDREARPVAFTRGRVHSTGFANAIVWFYDGDQGKWLGWECDSHHRGTLGLWRVLGDPDSPDYVADEPKDSADFYTDPVFQGVSLEQFIGFASSVLMTDGEVTSPRQLAEEIASRPYDTRRGGASFYAIPTPQDKWGWVYETVSGHQLIWLPGDVVYTRGMKFSKNFRGDVEGNFGAAASQSEPEWLDAALTLALAVNRPWVGEYGEEPHEVDNEGFFAAIKRRPLEVYGELGQPPATPVRSSNFHADMVNQARVSREQRVHAALQMLRAAAVG